MKLRLISLLFGLLLALQPLPLAAQDRALFFVATAQRLDDSAGFLSHWQAAEGALTLGMPISPQFADGPYTLQYFERGRLEQSADGTIMRAAVGREVLILLGRLGVPSAGARPVAAAAIAPALSAYYRLHGAAERFGTALLPAEWQYSGDAFVLVQYFSAARLQVSAAGDISIAELGRELLTLRGISYAPDTARGAQAVNADGSPSSAVPVSSRTTQQRIVVDLSDQWLYALDGGRLVFDAPVTTGRPGWETPVGEFRIYYKLRLQTMDACARGQCWHVPDVPHVMYINGGVALHGTYWHNAFGSGRLLSHGCVNLPLRSAAWLYDWAPYGTPVTVRE